MDDALKRTPLYEEHLALGARMTAFAGWEMPLEYAGIVEEHRAVRESVGVFDVGHMPEFRVFGFDAFDFLQGVLTNDLGKVRVLGSALYSLVCDEDGGIIDDVIVYHSGDLEYLIVGNAANRDADLAWLADRAPESVEVVDESDRTALIAVQGPRALRVLRELGGNGNLEIPPRSALGEARLGNVLVLLARTGYTGEDGAELVCHASNAAGLWRALLSFPEVTPAGLGARDTLRLEMGYRLYGQDIDRGVDPISAGLGWAVALDKGDFIGRDAIRRVEREGPERRLVGLSVADGIPRPGFPLLREGKEVGNVSSGTYSPTLGHGIALAYVPAELAEPGTELVIGIRGRETGAVVTRPPFVHHTSLDADRS